MLKYYLYPQKANFIRYLWLKKISFYEKKKKSGSLFSYACTNISLCFFCSWEGLYVRWSCEKGIAMKLSVQRKRKNNKANSVDESEKLEYGQLSKACTLELAFIISSNSLGNKKVKALGQIFKNQLWKKKKQPFAESLLSTGYYVHMFGLGLLVYSSPRPSGEVLLFPFYQHGIGAQINYMTLPVFTHLSDLNRVETQACWGTKPVLKSGISGKT